MSSKKSATSASPITWTVAEFGAFYTEHRSELLTHANRVLKDSAKAEEITQDALIKFMLAAPELESTEHALSYLHRTIENLCIDLFRLEGRRPNLVVLDDATAEIEATWQDSGDHSAAMSAAEDAAIIRQALAMLSPAERAALVMWEMEGRSTEEIAAELGIKETAVRHTVSRARASLRRVLSELIIDEERGLTALDLLSTSYKKASAVAKKSSTIALSLLLVVTAFLGFNSMTGNEGSFVPSAQVEATAPTLDVAPQASVADVSPSTVARPTPSAVASTPAGKSTGLVGGFAVKGARVTFAGLDKEGIPTGFTVADSSNKIGKLFVGKDNAAITDAGMTLTTKAMTTADGPNILINQVITVDGTGTSYSADAAVGINGGWASLNASSTSTNIERLANGNYLMSVTMIIDSAEISALQLATNSNGYDLTSAPKAITMRLLLTAGKNQILGQAISISDSTTSSKGATS